LSRCAKRREKDLKERLSNLLREHKEKLNAQHKYHKEKRVTH
jgi:hypothetical protein